MQRVVNVELNRTESQGAQYMNELNGKQRQKEIKKKCIENKLLGRVRDTSSTRD